MIDFQIAVFDCIRKRALGYSGLVQEALEQHHVLFCDVKDHTSVAAEGRLRRHSVRSSTASSVSATVI